MPPTGIEAQKPRVSIVVLNYRRREALARCLDSILSQCYDAFEIIVVDNNSQDGAAEFARQYDPRIQVIELGDNRGACGGRNAGIAVARGEFVVTLDNDVVLLSPSTVAQIADKFDERPDVHVLAFQVCDPDSGKLRRREWCHPRDWRKFAESEFQTHFFVEGACAYRKNVFSECGNYYEPLFIYNEGFEFALRILEHGYRILYTPSIKVGHLMSQAARSQAKAYYFFTRNYFWLSYKNFSFFEGVRFLAPRIAMMFYFTLRSGCYREFFRGIRDGVKGLTRIRQDRRPISRATSRYLRELESWRPSLLVRLSRHRDQPQL